MGEPEKNISKTTAAGMKSFIEGHGVEPTFGQGCDVAKAVDVLSALPLGDYLDTLRLVELTRAKRSGVPEVDGLADPPD